MKAAIVIEAGKPPVYGDFRNPVPEGDEVRLTVSAAALSTVAKSRASGRHYSSPGSIPFVVGIDGVGRLDDGRRMYFVLPRAPFGSMAEQTVVPIAQCVVLPDELDDVTAAAIANPGMSAWAALVERAHLTAGEVVLVNGATGTAGRLAVQIARHLGARKVIATGRNAGVLGTLGADVAIPLGSLGDEFEAALQAEFQSGIDIVLDYLWGPSAERIIVAAAKAAREALPIRFVHIGSVSSPEITLPSAALRSSAIELMGSGIGSIPMHRLVKSVADLMQAAIPAGLTIATTSFALRQVDAVWETAGNYPRAVFQIP